MQSILVYDSNHQRVAQLSLLLRLARYPFHLVGSLEEACNHVATLADADGLYRCLLVNDVASPAASEEILATLAHLRFPLDILLVERFQRRPVKSTQRPGGDLLRVHRCRPEGINEALSILGTRDERPLRTAVSQ